MYVMALELLLSTTSCHNGLSVREILCVPTHCSLALAPATQFTHGSLRVKILGLEAQHHFDQMAEAEKRLIAQNPSCVLGCRAISADKKPRAPSTVSCPCGVNGERMGLD